MAEKSDTKEAENTQSDTEMEEMPAKIHSWTGRQSSTGRTRRAEKWEPLERVSNAMM